MSSSTEDALCINQINTAHELVGESGDVDIQTEKHYNHYGDRGVADLFIRETYPNGSQDDHVYEFKSASAVTGSTGANEILRQFNRMCAYFYQDDTIDLPKSTSASRPSEMVFFLVFEISPETYAHVLDNFEIYTNITTPTDPSGFRDTRSVVSFACPETGVSTMIASSTDTDDGLTKEVVSGMARERFGEDACLEGDSR